MSTVSAGSAASAPLAAMDPRAPLPAGEPLLLTLQRASAPLSPQPRAAIEHAMRAASLKPLRPRKERAPVATTIDPDQVRGAGAAFAVHTVGPPVVTPRVPTAPAPSPGGTSGPTLRLSFRGGLDDNTGIPPDTSGAVSPDHVVNPLNNTISIFDRAGSLLSALPLDAFWDNLGIKAATFDPKIVFDPYAGRFVLVSMANAERATSSLLIAVSTSADPTRT